VIEGSSRRKKSMRTQGAASAALRVSEAIKAIVDSPRGATASEVAPVIGISRTASLRLLESMVVAGILSKDEESRRYNLSLQVFQWGSRAAARFQPSAAMRQEMTRLASQSGYQLIYSVLDGDSVVVLEATEHFTAQATTRPVWGRTYWASTTTGTLIAAFSEQRTIEPLLRAFEKQKEASAWPEIEMRSLLDELRRQGYADRVVKSGAYTIAAPVLDYSGYAVAALGMIVTSNNPLEKERFIDPLKATAATCSSFLGHHELNSSH
jgi:IclR family transcriptional regulator, KDG regulon repressor